MAIPALCACEENRLPAAPTSPPPIGTTTPDPAPTVVRSASGVRGTVVDFETQQPLSGVVVMFANQAQVGDTLVNVTQAITDADGHYSMPPKASSLFFIDNRLVGYGNPFSTRYRADLMVHTGTCIARYGMVMERDTFLPIAGARVESSGASAMTDNAGWYRIDWGCPSSGIIGGNTTFLTATHPDYQVQRNIEGRGIQSVRRVDVTMRPLGR